MDDFVVYYNIIVCNYVCRQRTTIFYSTCISCILKTNQSNMFNSYIVIGRRSPGNPDLNGYQDVFKVHPDPCLINFKDVLFSLLCIIFSLFALLSVVSKKNFVRFKTPTVFKKYLLCNGMPNSNDLMGFCLEWRSQSEYCRCQLIILIHACSFCFCLFVK